MKRGEIYFAQLDPTVGSEIRKTRPVLIVSNNVNNKCADTITIVPLTSNTKNVYPFEVFFQKKETQLKKDSKAQCNQIRTISKKRVLNKRAGFIDKKALTNIDKAIRLHLGLI